MLPVFMMNHNKLIDLFNLNKENIFYLMCYVKNGSDQQPCVCYTMIM